MALWSLWNCNVGGGSEIKANLNSQNISLGRESWFVFAQEIRDIQTIFRRRRIVNNRCFKPAIWEILIIRFLTYHFWHATSWSNEPSNKHSLIPTTILIQENQWQNRHTKVVIYRSWWRHIACVTEYSEEIQ